MPLAFASRSHGTVAFGFFNIASDMLLLERLFFFADGFCRAMEALAEAEQGIELPGWRIDRAGAVGNLHGAIAGFDLSGFIGATYRRWPFPALPQDFKQHPEGWRSQEEVAGMIEGFGSALAIPVSWDGREAGIGDYRFDREGLRELLRYVDRGGYPRWKGERRPEYVAGMMERLRGQGEGVFAGLG